MEETSLQFLRVLIVDDSQAMRELLQALLEAMGITDIVEAENGEDGYRLFKEKAPDIIITDGAMSPMDGYELTDRIRKDPVNPNPYVPIIMLSGYLGMVDIEKARAKGVSEYLAKPVSSVTLYERIIAIVGNPYYFIKTPTYLGPDRRRSTEGILVGAERRTSDAVVALDGKIIPFGSRNKFGVFRSYE